MRKYYDRSATPLVFHKIFWWAILPIIFFFEFIRLGKALDNMDYNYGAVGIIEVLFYLAMVGLSIACFVGFFRWKAYSWYCVIILYSTDVVYDTYITVLYIVLHSSQSIYAAVDLLVALIVLFLIGLYYIKRRPLFFPEMRNPYAAGAGGGERPAQVSEAAAADSFSRAKYCAHCGAVLPDGGSFCSKCGAPVKSVQPAQKS